MPGRLTLATLIGAAVLAGLPVEPILRSAPTGSIRGDDDNGRQKAEQRRRELDRRRAAEARRRAEDRKREEARRIAEERARTQARLRAQDGRRRAAARARLDQMQREVAGKTRPQEQEPGLRDGIRTSASPRPSIGSGPALRTLRRNKRAEIGIDRVPSARYFRVHYDAGNCTAYYVTTIDRLRYRLTPRDHGPVFDPLNPYSGVVDVPAGLWTTRIDTSE